MPEDDSSGPYGQRIGRAAHIVGCLAVVGLAASLLHSECYVLARERALLAAGALALWVFAAAGRHALLTTLPGRLAMTGALVVVFDWTRVESLASFEVAGLEVALSWSIIPLTVLVVVWLVHVAQGQSNPRSAGPFPLAVLLASGLVLLVGLICFPLFGLAYEVGADTFLSLVVTALQFGGLAVAVLDLLGRGMPRWALVLMGAALMAKALLAGVMSG